MDSDRFDVAVVGAGPAGATVSMLLAKTGKRVVLLERGTFPRQTTHSTWLSTAAVPILDELGVDASLLKGRGFTDVSFIKADFTQTAKPVFESPAGYLIDRATFDNRMADAVTKHEVTLLQGVEVKNIKQLESSVAFRLSEDRVINARLLIVATGYGSELPERVGVAPGRTPKPQWSAQVEAPLDKKLAPKEPRVGVVLGLDGKASFGSYFVSPERVSVGVQWRGDKSKVIPTLVHVCQQCVEHELLPIDVSKAGLSAKVMRTPASIALDMDSHVGKHALVIGDAGGFISAASHEGIYPAMWSAQIAAEVAATALTSTHSQDELMAFDSAWRIRMAEYLRPPHTDIQFLLPLIFSNQPMADRMGAAFFHGENI